MKASLVQASLARAATLAALGCANLSAAAQAPEVAPAAVDAFPKILSYGVYAREYVGRPTARHCGGAARPQGATLDLRTKGCNPSNRHEPALPRFYATLKVDNPSQEPIAYAWRLLARPLDSTRYAEVDVGTGPTFDLQSRGNTNLATRDCRIELKLKAPQTYRQKSLTVWSGRCTYHATRQG